MVRILGSRLRVQARKAFTLVEMLAVLAILAIFTAVTVPGLSSMVRDYNLMDAGNRIVGELNQARQTAISRNQCVEVRFYLDNADHQYDCMISLIPATADAGNQWLERPLFLPMKVVFNTSNANYSPLITTTTGTSPKAGTDNDPDSPSLLRGESYVAFHFRPDGSTDLDADAWSDAWCLTLDNIGGTAGKGGAPAVNYVTILLDPVVGRTRLYQPH